MAEELGFAGDWTDRYRLLVEWGEAIEPLRESECVDVNAVAGCSSPLWVKAQWVGGFLVVRGASSGILPRALVAIVCRLFDGVGENSGSVNQIMETLELNRHLSPTRSLVLERMLDRALGERGPGND